MADQEIASSAKKLSKILPVFQFQENNFAFFFTQKVSHKLKGAKIYRNTEKNKK